MKHLTFLLCLGACMATGLFPETCAALSPESASRSAAPVPATAPGFTLEASSASISLTPGGAAQSVTIAAFPQGSFSGKITVTAASMPAGVTMTPTSFTLSAGSLRTISISAIAAAKTGAGKIELSATAGTSKANASISTNVLASASASLSGNFFDFGNNLVRHSLVKTVVAVKNTGVGTLTMNPTLSGDASYRIVKAQSCAGTLAAEKTCDITIEYTPATPSAPKAQNALLTMNFGNVAAGTQQTVALMGTSAALTPGTVTKTANTQVALYSMTLPFPGMMRVSFGPTAAFGLMRWVHSRDTAGGTVGIFVAGMLQNSTYHMRATVQLPNGVTASDEDHTFATGAAPQAVQPKLQVTTTPGMTPQPGLEFVNPLNALVVTDLKGNSLWTYADPGQSTLNIIEGAKMLPDGNILMVLGEPATAGFGVPPAEGAIDEIREVTLGGTTVKEISIDDLNAELSVATCAECNVSLGTFHHDVTPLPNGHWLVLGATIRNLSPTTTPPLTNLPAQAVAGDVIVDLDENLQPVWAWNEFNHLDPNRHPMLFPDWTHTNAVIYSPDDGNILVSIRHQNWVVKVNYADGAGDGAILWHLGEGGEFKLSGGVDPTDWNYAQHGSAFRE